MLLLNGESAATKNTEQTIQQKKNNNIEKNQYELITNTDENGINNELVRKNSTDLELNQKNDIYEQNEKLAQKKNTKSFPIPLALTILIVWIAFSAGMFCLWETEWGYVTSVYFFFVSIRYC